MTHPSQAALLTVEEAREICARQPDRRYELIHGELVEVAHPKYHHRVIQEQVRQVLHTRMKARGHVFVECGFRGTPECNFRVADVALISRERHRQAVEKDDIFSTPELVIEVISPSNRAREMEEKEAFCFANGCQSFWRIDPVRRRVKVTESTGQVRWFKEGDTIDLAPFADGSIPVSDIFAPLE